MPYHVDRVPLAGPLLDDLAAARVREGSAPACSWAAFGPGGVAAAGVRTIGGGTMDTSAAFRVASCTKSLTAATLLSVIADGGITLDTPVTEVLDARVLGDWRAPTLGELASMAGGIPVDDPWADRQESIPAAAFDALVGDGIRLAFEPGSRYEYSSFAYAILGRVLERVTGTPYPRLAHARVIDPLELPGLSFVRTPEAVDGFVKIDEAWDLQPWAEPGAFSALGGMIASPTALAGWAGWLASAWRDDAADDVLAADARLAMQSPRTPVTGHPDRHYGLGLVVEEDPRHGRIVSHSGGYPGFGAHMRWHAATGLGVVVVENARYSGATVPATQALAAMLDAAQDPEAVPPLWPETAAARDTVERLLRRWDDGPLAAIAADNLELDESFASRRAIAAGLRDTVGIDPDTASAPLEGSAAESDSPAHLVWSVRGATGIVRCEIRMTPVLHPRLQTLTLRLG